MASSSESSKGFVRTAFVRQMVMRNPDVTLDQVKQAWEKAGRSKDETPVMHDIHLARTIIRKKYGVKEPHQIPRKANGEVNVTGVLRLVLKKHPKYKMKQALRYLLPEGLTFTPSLWSVMMHHDRKAAGKPSVQLNDSPDDNQNAGPRARRKTNRRQVKANTKVNTSSLSRLMDIEASLDQIIQKVDGAEMQNLAQALRDARRHISANIYMATH